MKRQMPKIIVYTCITNNYDWLFPPVWQSSNVRFICFTDNPKLKAKGWEVRPLPSAPGMVNGVLANRYCKFFPWRILPEHNWSIYIDANIRLLTDPTPIIKDAERRGYEMALFTHPDRSNIFQEADACIKRCKVTSEEAVILNKMLHRYRNMGLPKESGLTENNVIFRSGKSDMINSVMKLWWEELVGGVKRDQISLPYILWVTKTPVYRLPFSARDNNPYFRIVPHRQERNLAKYLKARRYHGAGWEVLYLCMWGVSGVLRRILRGFSKC